MPILEIHQTLAKLPPEKRTDELLEEAWKHVKPQAERRARGCANRTVATISQDKLVRDAKRLIFERWRNIPGSVAGFSTSPRRWIAKFFTGYRDAVAQEHFQTTKEHIAQYPTQEIQDLDRWIKRYGPELKKSFE